MPNDESEVSEKDADKLLVELKALAADWREKLADPVMRRLVAEGKVKVNPLVEKLLRIKS